MSETMTSFVMHGIGKVGVMEKPIPRPGSNDAIIRTTAALMGVSDKIYRTSKKRSEDERQVQKTLSTMVRITTQELKRKMS